jgi:uncharacterized membrane protein YciS (DUF1049 family)
MYLIHFQQKKELLASKLTSKFLLLQKGQDKIMLLIMFALIVLFIFGIGVAFFATQNTQAISITLANYPLTGIPLYLIVLVSLLLGFVVSWIISSVDVIASALKMHGKENTIKNANKQISELTKRVHQLELENERLKGESGHPRDDKSL